MEALDLVVGWKDGIFIRYPPISFDERARTNETRYMLSMPGKHVTSCDEQWGLLPCKDIGISNLSSIRFNERPNCPTPRPNKVQEAM